MKILIKDFEDHSEIIIQNADGSTRENHIVGDKKEATVFITGFNSAKLLINSMVQSLPLGYERKKV